MHGVEYEDFLGHDDYLYLEDVEAEEWQPGPAEQVMAEDGFTSVRRWQPTQVRRTA